MVKKASNHKIVKRGDGRYEVRVRGGKRINGLEKTKILIDAGLVKMKIKAPAAAEEPKAE